MNNPIYEEPREILERIERELREQDPGMVYSRLRRLENGLLELVDVCGLLLRWIEELEAANDLAQ